ncbi:FK506-binding -like protein [Labeo rohita]|uniref:FK506-binding-like protein n=1 Tax=Labeo rohita TaxID=84645 RepID=A0A498MUU4_LABRO|nr:FK506-binding protein-like [Labeo rohita]RXN02733.1 FK506-binding -like protein [Labeo rohita]RXN23603.1 FK506-binding -like protein [Labeo rohita]
MTTVQVPDRIPSETSWVSACPGGLWEVRRKWLGERQRGDITPMMGSLCKVKVRRSTVTEGNTLHSASQEEESTASVDPSEQATSYPRSQDSVLQVPLDEWCLLRMGEGHCDIIEGCLEGMRAGEMCEFTISAWNAKNSKAAGSDANDTQTENTTAQGSSQQSDCFTLQLHSLTPGQESWQMTPGEKWAWVLSHKQRGGQRFGKGDIWGAVDCYCRAVKLAITLNSKTRRKPMDEASKEILDEEDDEDDDAASTPCFEKENEQAESADISIPTEEEYKTVKAELHCNLSLCQLKLGQLVKSRDSSIKATELNPTSTKAWYRLGQACLQLGELEESRMAFGKILELQPDSASARTALKEVNSRLKDLDNKLGQRLSKMFN